MRRIIQERGLLLPQYVNGPSLVYVVQGSQSRSQSQRDQYQKVQQIREGYVVGLPTGVPKWVYNNGLYPLVLVTVVDTNNRANQQDRNARRSEYERGERGQSQRPSEQQYGSENVFSGLDERLLAEVFNVNTDLARKLSGEEDYRGIIVRLYGGLEVLNPQQSPEGEQHTGSSGSGRYNGVEETFCTLRLQHNVNDPSQAGVFNPRAGRVTNVNSNNLPVLTRLQLSVQKGVHYRGIGQVQMVDDNGNTVFDGWFRRVKFLTAPQNYGVVKRASAAGLEWVSFKTNDNARTSQLAGQVSVIRAMPVDVVANSYQVSMEEARRLKENRLEVTMLSPWSRSRYSITQGSD
ncbi:hypothetical protein P3X46_006298 [Hevea brasiliensis]|uniref:Cupin type-1 domain-containing protein n=1 Tax=Hevea brasiliensis TaxID=3981 RepID=A0ABQ9MQR7_HEVBR|nr:hypothetical protein P3X46_006298 [Hevea brasiliensis]